MGIPGAGKTTAARTLAEYFEVPYLHSGGIAKHECPGDWIAYGDMAPEPCATIAVEQSVEANDQWILDGFPRSAAQLRSTIVRREAIVYLDVSKRVALRRAKERGKNPQSIEAHRIEDQFSILSPVKMLAAVVIPTSFRDAGQVVQMIIDWYERDIHPSEHGSNAR